jgi:diguanylate cyclase (GGDEF)-like protein
MPSWPSRAPGDGVPDEVAARLLTYLDRTDDLVGVADDVGNIVYLNHAARERLGIKGDEENVTTADLFPERAFDIYFEQVRPRIVRGEVWTGYLPVRGPGDDTLEMWVTVAGEARPGGEVAWLVLSARDINEWRHIREDLHRSARRDELTRLPTRSVLMDHLDKALDRARRTGDVVAVMCIDLDQFTTVNDTWGRSVGDAVLIEVGHRLQDAVRAADTVARVGGDGFAVVLDGVEDEDEAQSLATRVHAILESTAISTEGATVNVSASAGLAIGGGHEDAARLLARADTAMYEVKDERRPPPIWTDQGMQARQRAITAHDVAVAVTQGAIVPWYQPVLETESLEVVAYQALARWMRPSQVASGGDAPVPASEFVAAVEGSAIGFSLDLSILRHAASETAGYDGTTRLYVHVGSRFLTRAGIDRFLSEVLDRARLTPHRLTLVVPGSVALRRIGLMTDALSAVIGVGVRIAVDLPLGMAPELPPQAGHLFSELRLGLGWSKAGEAALHRLVDLAHDRGLQAHAIAVDTPAELEDVTAAGCDLVEGRSTTARTGPMRSIGR